MYSFKNDYSEGAHPNILQALQENNLSQEAGYGEDEYSLAAKAEIKRHLNNTQAEIYFVTGGTQANLLVISSLLRPHEAVISAKSGHINTHEAGAIEALGHRILSVPTNDGKLTLQDIDNVLHEYALRPHVVKPKLVYISNTTEVGTQYSKVEIQKLSHFCRSKNLFLYIDGARLGQALTSSVNDLNLQDISLLTDAFYIGGTKNGALLGEAIVFNHPNLNPEFDYILKQKGALLAKGRLLGIQFLELFKNNLYFENALHANQMAMNIKKAIEDLGFPLLHENFSNQLFPILPNSLIQKLLKKYEFYEWQRIDKNHTAIRLITSWATKEEVIQEFIKDLKKDKDRDAH